MRAGSADQPVPDGPAKRLLVELTIQREPMPAPRMESSARGHRYMPGQYRAERDALALIFRTAMRGKHPASGPVEMFVTWTRSSGRRTKADLDNLLKTTMDAGNGILYDDDAQVLQAHPLIMFGTPGETWLKVVHRDAADFVR